MDLKPNEFIIKLSSETESKLNEIVYHWNNDPWEDEAADDYKPKRDWTFNEVAAVLLARAVDEEKHYLEREVSNDE